PLEQIVIGLELAEAVAQAGFAHLLERHGSTALNVFVRHAALGKAALDGDGTEPVGFDEPLEKAVAKDQEFLPTVERFRDAEEFDAAEARHHTVDRSVERALRVEREREGFVFDPVAKRRVRHAEFLTATKWKK